MVGKEVHSLQVCTCGCTIVLGVPALAVAFACARMQLTLSPCVPHPLTVNAQVEPWQRFPYLETGYRKHGSHWECAMSMFFGPLHNETVNAWTMAISLALGTWMFVGALSRTAPSGWDATPFWVLYLAQLLHCPVSIGYHTFMPISALTAHRWRKADLCLVLALNVACTYSLCYFTLNWLLTLALTAVAAACAATGMRDILLLKPVRSCRGPLGGGRGNWAGAGGWRFNARLPSCPLTPHTPNPSPCCLSRDRR